VASIRQHLSPSINPLKSNVVSQTITFKTINPTIHLYPPLLTKYKVQKREEVHYDYQTTSFTLNLFGSDGLYFEARDGLPGHRRTF
jgi:hypothetical protein